MLDLVLVLIKIQFVACQYTPSVFEVAHLSQKQSRTTNSLDRGAETTHKVICYYGTLVTFDFETEILLYFIELLNLFRLCLFGLNLRGMITV